MKIEAPVDWWTGDAGVGKNVHSISIQLRVTNKGAGKLEGFALRVMIHRKAESGFPGTELSKFRWSKNNCPDNRNS